MKINKAFCYRKIADKYLLIAVKKNSLTNSILEINQTAAFMLELVSKNIDRKYIVNKVLEEYNLSCDYRECINKIINDFLEMGIIIDE